MLPFVSLNAVTSSGDGEAYDLVGGYATHTLSVTIAGSASGGGDIGIYGSLDGENWESLASASVTSGMTFKQIHVTGVLVRYVRASITSGNFPAGATSVTATILSGRS